MQPMLLLASYYLFAGVTIIIIIILGLYCLVEVLRNLLYVFMYCVKDNKPYIHAAVHLLMGKL